MTSVVSLRSIVMQRLNELPPHSRKREGYVDLIKHLTAEELVFANLERELVEAMDRDPAFAADAGMAH